MADSDPNRAVYVISVAAELTGVHPQTLRIYERKGLLDPSRTSGGSRRFSDADLTRLRHIQQLTATGLNLEGVRRVLELEGELARVRAEGKKKLGRPMVGDKKEDAIRARLTAGDGMLKVARTLGVGVGTVQRVKAEMPVLADPCR